MIILSIETSCDETALSILDARGTLLRPRFTLLGNALYSQAKLHAEYGGVFPTLAKREHIRNLPILLDKVLAETNLSPAKIDAIAVTYGPGLEPALWTGITFAERLGKEWNVPVVPVNHMEGHVVSPLLNKTKNLSFHYPILALLISGGHTELVVSKKPLSYSVIGKTRDDALGECYDKAARMMGLPYPGGPEIYKLAQKARDRGYHGVQWKLPRPMIYTKDFDFSFSGLKTAVLYAIRDHGTLTAQDKENLAKEFEDAVTDVIVAKTRKAIMQYKPRTLVVGGGVIANTFIRTAFANLSKEFTDLAFSIPERELATDNAVMIAMAGYLNILKKPSILKSKKKIKASGNISL